jgi:hypothetical protein
MESRGVVLPEAPSAPKSFCAAAMAAIAAWGQLKDFSPYTTTPKAEPVMEQLRSYVYIQHYNIMMHAHEEVNA